MQEGGGPCFDEFFSHDFPKRMDWPSSYENAHDEMLQAHATFERRLRKARRGDSIAIYLDHFRSARFSNGQDIYPNVAQTLSGSESLNSGGRLRLAQKVAASLRSERTRSVHELLVFMPKTAISLLAAMEPQETNGMAGFLLNAISSGTRFHDMNGEIIGTEGPLAGYCGKIRDGTAIRMSRGQLRAFDDLYSNLAAGFIDSEKECRSRDYPHLGIFWISCDTTSRSVKNLCEDFSRRQKSGEALRFGIPKMGLACAEEFHEDRCGSPYSLYSRQHEACTDSQRRRIERWRSERQ